MIEQGQQVVIGAALQDSATGDNRQLAIGIKGEMPVDIRELERLMQYIYDMEQLLTFRFDQQARLAQGMSLEVYRGHARCDLFAFCQETEFVAQRIKATELQLIVGGIAGCPAPHPFVPFGSCGDVVRIGIAGAAVCFEEAGNVVTVKVREVDDIDVCRCHTDTFKCRARLPHRWGPGCAETDVSQNPGSAAVDIEQIQAAFRLAGAQGCFDLVMCRVGVAAHKIRAGHGHAAIADNSALDITDGKLMYICHFAVLMLFDEMNNRDLL